MPQFDLPIEELRNYRPEIAEPDGFDEFWTSTLAENASFPLNLRSVKLEQRLRLIDTYDLTFTGFGGAEIKAWLHVPAGTTGELPTVVQYQGYAGGRAMPLDTVFAQAGYAQFILDSRGQGWGHRSLFDTTPDPDVRAGLSAAPGMMTQGILNPVDYYYRRLMTDAARLLQVASEHRMVDSSRMFVYGGSQGGGLAISAAALAPRLGIELKGCAANVPFLCHFARGIMLTGAAPYVEVEQYLRMYPQHVDQALWTLSHFDGANFAKRIACPVMFSVGLLDEICPPSTVYAAYNNVTTEKVMEVYPFNGHEGGGEIQTWRILGWMADRLS